MPENGQPRAIAAAFESIENQGDCLGHHRRGPVAPSAAGRAEPCPASRKKLVYPLDLGGNIGFETARMPQRFCRPRPAIRLSSPSRSARRILPAGSSGRAVQAEAAFDLLSRSGPPAAGGSEIADLIDLRNEVVGCPRGVRRDSAGRPMHSRAWRTIILASSW
jgi:hypothetical protein